MQVQILLSAL